MVQLTLILHVKIDMLLSFCSLACHTLVLVRLHTKQLINLMLNCKWYTYLVFV